MSLSIRAYSARLPLLSALRGPRLLASPAFTKVTCISKVSKYTSLPGRTKTFSTTIPLAQEHTGSRGGKGLAQGGGKFELDDRTYIVTGGAQGLGLVLAEAVVGAGGHVYCLDRLDQPNKAFRDTQDRLSRSSKGSLHYRRADVTDAANLNQIISEVAAERQRMDGLIAAAGIQNVVPALDYPPEKIPEMLAVNYTGVYLSAVACAREMLRYKTPGSMCLVGSMSGLNANKGFTSSVYNSSKAAVIQLGRSLAMEWGNMKEFEDCEPRKRGIRVNVLCPGNIMTPMVAKNFADDPQLRATWENANMMNRISEPDEYQGAVLFMLSDASSFMTGSHLVIDGGYTAW